MTLTAMTLAEWDALPEDGDRRLECVEGVVVVVPEPQLRHNVAGNRLWAALEAALPPDLRAGTEVAVLLAPAPVTVRVPDVAVLDADVAPGDHRFSPSQIHLVVEVLSPGRRRSDLVTKRAEYAEAGIAEYWIVDLDAPSLTQLRLTGSVYDLVAEHTGTATIETCGTSVTLDLDTLGT